jgi:hypothetical protein
MVDVPPLQVIAVLLALSVNRQPALQLILTIGLISSSLQFTLVSPVATVLAPPGTTPYTRRVKGDEVVIVLHGKGKDAQVPLAVVLTVAIALA